MGLISGGRRGRVGFGMAHLLLLIIGVSWLSFSSVEGLKCYVCVGSDNCKKGEKDCPGSEGCNKGTFEVGGDIVAIKACGNPAAPLPPGLTPAPAPKENCGPSPTLDGTFTTCYCNGDLCNASTKRYSPSLMILLAASTLTALVTKFGHFGVLRGGI